MEVKDETSHLRLSSDRRGKGSSVFFLSAPESAEAGILVNKPWAVTSFLNR